MKPGSHRNHPHPPEAIGEIPVNYHDEQEKKHCEEIWLWCKLVWWATIALTLMQIGKWVL